MSKILIFLIASLSPLSFLNAQTEDKLLMVGDFPPDFSATTVDGKPFKLSECKGKYVLLNFWGTWCLPCIHEIPDLRDIQLLYGSTELEIVSIAVERKEKDIKFFTDSAGMKWTNISELNDEDFQKTISYRYGVGMFPTNYLLDKEGKIIAFPFYFVKDSTGKIKMSYLQGPFIYQTLSKYLGDTKDISSYLSQSKGTLFSLSEENAKNVLLSGSFNQWGGKALYRVNGKWFCKVDLSPGTYQYKYIVDGNWIVDPANPYVVDDGSGNKNSQIIIK